MYTVQQVSRIYSSCITETLYTCQQQLFFSFLSLPSNYHSILCSYEFDSFRYYMKVESCIVCPSVTDLFHLASCHVWQDIILFYGRTIFHYIYIYICTIILSIHSSIDGHLIVSISCLL